MTSLFECFRSGTTVTFLTGGCFCINCASLIFYSGGLIRDKTVMGKALGYGWIFDLLFSLECALNGISDLALLAAVSYRTMDAREGFPMGCLTCTLKGFILWNTFSVVACWTASCALYYERDRELGAVYPYALFNESALTPNATSATLVNKNFIPTLAMLYIAATLTAVFKLLVLYAVYYGYLQVVLREAVLADPFVAYARECDTTQSSLHAAPAGAPEDGPEYYGGGRADVACVGVRPPGRAGRIPKEWGQPSQTSFRPRTEWSSSEDRLNPFAENGNERLTGVQVISSTQSSYPLDRWTSPGRMCPPEKSLVSVMERAATDPGSPSVAHTMPVLPYGPVGPNAAAQAVFSPGPPGPPGYQRTVQPWQLPPPRPAVPAGPPMPPPLPNPMATSPVPPYSSSGPVPSTMPQPHCPAQEQPAGPTPSFPPIVPVQAPSLFKVNGDAPSPRERKRRRTVSISESPSVATFSPSDTAAGIGGPAQASTDSGQPSAGRSNESVAITLSRLLSTLAANVSDSR